MAKSCEIRRVSWPMYGPAAFARAVDVVAAQVFVVVGALDAEAPFPLLADVEAAFGEGAVAEQFIAERVAVGVEQLLPA